MNDWLSLLEKKAFRVIPGADYNDFRRDGEATNAAPTAYFEEALAADAPWGTFRERIFPSFARSLKSKSIDPAAPGQATVAIFVGDRCFLLEGKSFIDIFLTIEGIDAAAFRRLVRTWL